MTKTKTILYCIGGLGTDRTVFSALNILGVSLKVLDWLPHHKRESLESYAQRLAASADFPTDYYLLGVSFGGMLATEIAKKQPPKKLFLISSLQHSSDVPAFYRVVGNLKTHHLMPVRLLKSSNVLSRFFFGVNNETNRRVFKTILEQTDPKFLRWALDAILRWRHQESVPAVRIHGTKDRILTKQRNALPVDGAGHFMIHSHADQIAEIIHEHLFEKLT